VSESDGEASIMRNLGPLGAVAPLGKKPNYKYLINQLLSIHRRGKREFTKPNRKTVI
jgi:hypothetical protein